MSQLGQIFSLILGLRGILIWDQRQLGVISNTVCDTRLYSINVGIGLLTAVKSSDVSIALYMPQDYALWTQTYLKSLVCVRRSLF